MGGHHVQKDQKLLTPAAASLRLKCVYNLLQFNWNTFSKPGYVLLQLSAGRAKNYADNKDMKLILVQKGKTKVKVKLKVKVNLVQSTKAQSGGMALLYLQPRL
jgi:hypothetical protein